MAPEQKNTGGRQQQFSFWTFSGYPNSLSEKQIPVC
jgi:hypothetical protein